MDEEGEAIVREARARLARRVDESDVEGWRRKMKRVWEDGDGSSDGGGIMIDELDNDNGAN